MKAHILNVHGISLDDETVTLPDDLKQYYSELTGYKAKCNNCGKAVSFLTNIENLRVHLRRHSTKILNRDETTPTKKHSKFWNYFEELKPTLVKCTTCKKEIKISNRGNRIKIMRVHLFKKHGISLDDDTLTLPDDLKQNYSKLPGYKARCNDCDKILSFVKNSTYLREHLRRRHSTRIQSQDAADMVPRKKRSKLWNYFEELKPSLVKCTTCKKEIKIPHPRSLTTLFRAHLKRHEIFLDNDIRTLPDDLKQYYSELPGYKAKCKDCGKTLSFLTNMVTLRKHLRRHSTSIQSRNETVIIPRKKRSLPDDLKQNYSELPGYKAKCNNCGKTVSFLTNIANLRGHLKRHSTIIQSQDAADMIPRKKRSKLWNYFKELNPSLVKCTTCKKEIKISRPSHRTPIFRAHLKRHEIFLDNDIRTLPDDLKQYYSELPGYKAKCNNCGKALSFLTNIENLRVHLRRHSILPTRIQSRNDLSTSTSTCCVMDSSTERQNQDTSGLPIQSFQEATEKTGTLNEPSTLSSTAYIMDLSTREYIPLRQSQEQVPPGLPIQSFKETTEKTETLDEPSTSISTGFDTNHTAECQSQETVDLALQTCEQSRKQTRARVGTVIMAPKRKSRKLWNYFKELNPSLAKCTICKKEIKISYSTARTRIFRVHLYRHGIFLDNDTHTLPDDLKQYYSELPGYKAKCNNCGETVSFLTTFSSLRRHFRRHCTRTHSQDDLSTSTSTCCVMDSSAKRQNQDTSGLPIQSFKETTEKTETLDEPSTSTSTGYDTNHTAECQSQETVDLALQTCEQSRKQTRARVGTAQTKKRSKLWNYFEELKPLLVKCKKCKKHFDVPDNKKLMRTFRRHLFNVHGIFLDNDTLSLPDDLKQYCSELPGYKAKCNNCGQTVSFLTNFRDLRKHLRRHSTSIQSRNEENLQTLVEAITVPHLVSDNLYYRTPPTKKRSKLWNYFEELKPKLLKCTSCKKEIKVSGSSNYTKVMRRHLSRHGIFLDNDILSVPDDLKQYYSVLPGFKAKCNNCGKAMSFLTNFSNLREHLRRHYFSNKNPESK